MHLFKGYLYDLASIRHSIFWQHTFDRSQPDLKKNYALSPQDEYNPNPGILVRQCLRMLMKPLILNGDSDPAAPCAHPRESKKCDKSSSRAQTENIHVCALRSVASKLRSSISCEESASLCVLYQEPEIRFRKKLRSSSILNLIMVLADLIETFTAVIPPVNAN